jgi:hypothetical protein
MISPLSLLIAAATAWGLATPAHSLPGDPSTPRPAAELKVAAATTTVELARNGESRFRIVLRSPKSPPVAFAVAELTKYVEQISGAKLETDDAGGRGPRIVIGLRGDLSEEDRALLPKPAKGSDGYAIRVATDVGGAPRIVLGGDEPRGVVYGVYDLLERLGCRFFYPALDPSDPESVPHAPDLSLPAGSWAIASPLKYRTLAWFEWRREVLDTTPEQLHAQIEWAMKARYNVFETAALELPPDHPLARALRAAKERGMMLQVPGHNFDQFLPSDPQTFAEQPEWFGEKGSRRVQHAFYGAQFCWSNQEAQRRFTDNVVRFVLEHPDIDILELSGLDGGTALPCGCEHCAKRSPTDNVIELLNGVVARLAKEAPHVVVETLGGYQYSDRPPESVKPDPRLRVFWAHWGRVPTVSYATKNYARRQQLEAWAGAFDHRLTAFQYYSDHFANSWFTAPLVKQIEGDRRFLIDLGVDGMLNLLYPDRHWRRSSLNAYLAGRSFYDASLDPFALLRDYATIYFGPAGDLMAEYFDEWARFPKLGLVSRDRAKPPDLAMLRRQRAKWLRPAVAKVPSEPVYRRRVARLFNMHILAETSMESDIARQQAEAMIKAGDSDGANRELDRARHHLGAATRLAGEFFLANAGDGDRKLVDDIFRSKSDKIAKVQRLIDGVASQPSPGGGPPPQPTGIPTAS